MEKKNEQGEVLVDENNNPVKVSFIRFYKVFAIDDVIGLESRVPYEEHTHTIDEKITFGRNIICYDVPTI